MLQWSLFFVSERGKGKGKFESEKIEMDERKKGDYLSVLKYEWEDLDEVGRSRSDNCLAGFSFPETRLPPSEILSALHFTVLVRNYVPMRNNILISFLVGIKGGVGFVFFLLSRGFVSQGEEWKWCFIFSLSYADLKKAANGLQIMFQVFIFGVAY